MITTQVAGDARLPLLLAVTLSVAGAGSTPAQDVRTDPRWLSWLGCWERAEPAQVAWGAETRVACIVPTESASAVEIVAIVGGAIINRERIDASGTARAIDENGCTGTERAGWADGGSRLYRSAELECQGGLRQRVSQLFAITAGGDWLDVQGVSLDHGAGLRVLRYREAASLAGVPAEIASRLSSDAGAGRVRTAAGAPLTTVDVAEAALRLPPAVVQAWLAEVNQGFVLDARQLLALAAQGVPGEVIDVMVALSYPRVFQLDRVTQMAQLRQTPAGSGDLSGIAPIAYSGCDRYVDAYRWYRTEYCGYPGSYGYGYPGWGSWYWGSGPIIVVTSGAGGGSGGGSRSHGRVVNGAGYREGPGSPSSSRQGSQRDHTASSTAAAQGGGSASSGSGSTGSSGASSAPASSEPVRTAKPRP